MEVTRTLLRHGAAALATILLYKLLNGEDTTWVAAVVCMYLWWVVTFAAAGEWIKERSRRHESKDRQREI